MRPIKIPAQILKYTTQKNTSQEMCNLASQGYSALYKDSPEVSIVIPAYNEEENIVATLTSLCTNKTNRSVEIIVVDNNSKDKTQQLAVACGVKCVFQPVQGITVSRNMGLSEARGKYILNADADSIYPEDWIELMVKPLDNDQVALTYGQFALVPTAGTGRLTYFFYEYIAEFSRWINKKIKDEAVNVYGFNSGFRREQGLQVDGFNHPPGTNEDGWLALKLRNKGFGKLHLVNDIKALVWTTDRRIQLDGGLVKGTVKRVLRTLSKK
ncbi:glycosyltransferase [Pedobacter metabolipauper]|uniref:Glycosyl transferase family 2 n=1 Tax=Pedobacter metabolipauper TaxID=425513 RepID=A0A4R6T0P7_9SPHI|nr:glycosyltransferase family 2 protein [Pedobacter metabolipauper]TDQ12002.1 glycosyl transferase family 2 [Pedobacter metabolipauper]